MDIDLKSCAEELRASWSCYARWNGITRPYKAEDVLKLRASVVVEHTLAKRGAEHLWWLMNNEPYTTALGAVTGSQAVQMVKAGMKSIYVSGWQVAADANQSGNTYPDQSLYPCNSVPQLVKRINNALMRADQICAVEGNRDIDWYVPILADAEAGFGGSLHAFEIMKHMIEAGAAAVHFEDQLAAEKKCGHMGGKVMVPTSQFENVLVAARLAADVLDVPTIIVARTDALSAKLLTSDVDPRDRQFIVDGRTPEGYFRVRDGIEPVIARGLAYAPLADVLWFETSRPDLEEAAHFAEAIHKEYPGKLLAYNCSPSFNWKRNLDDATIARFNRVLGKLGYKYQFITLAGWHDINLGMYKLASQFASKGMPAYVQLQQEEFAGEAHGYTAVRHQREVGTGYFDKLLLTITGARTSTQALAESTEQQQFQTEAEPEQQAAA